jgi:hypothetical protein
MLSPEYLRRITEGSEQIAEELLQSSHDCMQGRIG